MVKASEYHLQILGSIPSGRISELVKKIIRILGSIPLQSGQLIGPLVMEGRVHGFSRLEPCFGLFLI
jgi:hypothetical protein